MISPIQYLVLQSRFFFLVQEQMIRQGGGIDLYVLPQEEEEASFNNKIKFGAALQRALEFQKIDILLSVNRENLIDMDIIQHAILLDNS